MSSRRREESGAVAIMVALMSVMLISVAALAVDLGQGFARKHEIQHDTDLAALAGGGGNNLPAPTPTLACSYGLRASASDLAVKDVATSFTAQVGSPTVTASQLTDCDTTNGEAFYGSVTQSPTGYHLTYIATTLTVLSPPSRVNFGLANVMGQSNVDVSSLATVQIRSPLFSSLPFYAFTGCDFGSQTIAQPTNGHASGLLFAHPDESNPAALTSLATSPASTPVQVPLNVVSPNDSLVINGTSLTGVTKIGFFESGTSSSGPEPVVVDNTGFALTGSTKITIPHLPTAVTSVQDYWYVRVLVGGQWSPVYTGHGAGQTLSALPLTVGTPTLTCGQGSSSGNFGTLLAPNSQGPNGQSANIAYNIATNIEHPLGVFPGAATPFTCGSSQTAAKLWPADGTNCVDTKTGLNLNAAQSGFISGVGGKPGRLTKVDTGTGCASNGVPATKAFGGYTINNDTLSCFLTDDTTTIGDIDGAAYPLTAPVLSPAIYKSPRFAIVPVLGVQPDNGGSNKYQVVGFRPAFITDQPNSATRTSTVTSTNGVPGSGGSVDSIQVVFINDSALPHVEGGDSQDYTGTGPKNLLLVN